MDETKKSLLNKYCNWIVVENELTVPSFLNPTIETSRIEDESEFRQTMFSAILSRCSINHVLVITESDNLFELLKTVNAKKQDYFIGIFFKNEWYIDEILKEFQKLENTLIDPEGKEHCLTEELLSNIFATDTDHIAIKTTGVVDWESVPLIKKESKEPWGVLLTNPAYKKSKLLGKLGEIECNLYDRALLLANICEEVSKMGVSIIPVYEKILVFNGGECLIAEYDNVGTIHFDGAFREFCFRALFKKRTHEATDLLETMLEFLKDGSIPDYLLRTLQQAYCEQQPVSFRKWDLIFQLLKLENEERIPPNLQRSV